MNFVWLDINASWSHSSLALPALHANLTPQTQAACNMQVVRGTIKSSIPQIIEELAALEPSYIFATAWLFNIKFLNEVLCRVSALCNPIGIFLGGPEFLGNNQEFLQANPHITAVFKGEGEEMFEQFITSLLAQNGAWKQIEGFEWIEGNEYYQSKAVIVKNFKNIHIPDNSSLFSWNKSFVQLETSRGCFNSCRFCVSGIEKTSIQNITVEELRTRLQHIETKGIKQIRVLDRTFNGNPARALELLSLFSEFAGKLNFHLEVHPALLFPAGEDTAVGNPNSCGESPAISVGKMGESSVDGKTGAPSAVGRLREALENVPEGLLHVEAGIQTLQQNVLDNCARKGSCAKALEGLEFLIGCGKFEVHADLIAGLPEYTYNQLLQDTLQLMQIGPAEIQLESLKLLPGTYFRNNAQSLGIRYSPTPPYEVLATPHISYSQLNKAMTLSKIIDFWYNDAKWREPFKEIFTNSNGNNSNTLLLEKLIEELNGTEYITQPLSLENKGLLLYRFCKKHTPQQAPLISLQWVKNGLSMKKEPTENFTKWELSQGADTNPLFVEGDPRYKYYYITICSKQADGTTKATTHWFAFNKEIERVAPCKYLKTE